MTIGQADVLWRPEDDYKVKPTLEEGDIYRPDILKVVETAIDNLSGKLRELSLDIHGKIMYFTHKKHRYTSEYADHPELRYEERYARISNPNCYQSAGNQTNYRPLRYAHDAYTSFLEKHGFEVTRHHLLETAWVATYTHGLGGRVLGVNSEMDALPGIGHACGHNLIGIAGVAVACAAKAAMEQLNIDGKVILLGTPGMSFSPDRDG